MKFEKEFKDFMANVFPKVPKDTQQYKASRIIFYSGAFTLVHSNKGGGKEELDELIDEVSGGLKFAKEFAKKGIQPEEALADLIESRSD